MTANTRCRPRGAIPTLHLRQLFAQPCVVRLPIAVYSHVPRDSRRPRLWPCRRRHFRLLGSLTLFGGQLNDGGYARSGDGRGLGPARVDARTVRPAFLA